VVFRLVSVVGAESAGDLGIRCTGAATVPSQSTRISVSNKERLGSLFI